ncbi:MAG TPA: D-alanyl-D-alanine carboxypeptidase family protein [Solirubrobacterales bacterium]|jgi:D-alanyl-D-alanine carboxypeptidase (penicillin-binding protein 5/6)|nr:D-alanyl-D-alanine carboxypeptidase family protein [Solirubrobacterales bacterium]
MSVTVTRPVAPGRLRLLLAVALLTAALVATGLVPASAGASTKKPPQLDAASWVLIDLKDGAELAARASGQRRAIASTTKLMTAYLALRDLRMGEKLVVPRYDAEPAESLAGLEKGERLTVHDLLVAMMLPSANDAAETVAQGIAGSEPAFVAEMNRAADKLGLDRTHYANPIGLDAKRNYSTAEDLTTLAEELLSDKRFRRIVAMPKAKLTSGARNRTVTNTNTLLRSDPTVDGVKTGHTTDAGYVLVASAKRDGVPLLAAVLGAPSETERNDETERLLDYGYGLYAREDAIERGAAEAAAAVRYEDGRLPLTASRGVSVEVRDDQEVKVDADGPAEVEGPIDAGERLGTATVTVDGRFIDRVPLVAGHAVAAPTIVDKIGGPVVVVLIVAVIIVILAVVVIALRRRRNDGNNGDRVSEERMRDRQERIRRRRRGAGE